MKRRDFITTALGAGIATALLPFMPRSANAENNDFLQNLPAGNLKIGSQGKQVEALETVLLKRGFRFSGRNDGPTGKFDTSFKRDTYIIPEILVAKGCLASDKFVPGEYNPQVRQAIIDDFAQRKKAYESESVVYDTAKHDNKKSGIKLMQQNLQSRRFFPTNIKPNGVYGPATELSVLKFQQAAYNLGLLEDDEVHGIYTSKTGELYSKYSDIITSMHAVNELEKMPNYRLLRVNLATS